MGFGALMQPRKRSQAATSWHESAWGHTTGSPPHTPAVQRSFCVQMLLSKQGMPSGAGLPTQAPALHWVPSVQGSKASQAAPSGSSVGTQSWLMGSKQVGAHGVPL